MQNMQFSSTLVHQKTASRCSRHDTKNPVRFKKIVSGFSQRRSSFLIT